MSTLSATNLKNASSGSNNIVLNSDGTVGGAALASASEMFGTRTTGTVTSGTTSLTVASATGITAGMFVVGEGITPGTTVSSIVSTTVTLSANANTTLSSDPVTFYANNKLVSPGVVGSMLCRAWVNFDGTASVAGNYIRAAYNVSSITDNGVGDYTVNFTTAMTDANYCTVTGMSGNANSSNGNEFYVSTQIVGPSYNSSYTTTSSIRMTCVDGAGSNRDAASLNVAIFR